ncbi:MAG: calcium/sodium antiporter [Paracoccaceae bacterium]|nr:calcium/sodium antiporter [Paracoccaceae bacterium]
MEILSTLAGLALLLVAGDTLVRGAVNLGLRLGIPALIVSLTVVAFGTSAPELLVAIKAAIEGLPGIAIGNVVGSNSANIMMVLGLPALMAGINSSKCDSRKTYVFMLIATIVFIALAFMGPLYFLHGVILLALLAMMLADQFVSARNHRRNGAALVVEPEIVCEPCALPEELEGVDPEMPYWKIWLYIILGVIGLPAGAELLINGALEIAHELGVSESVIGLTLVAVGTSLPELATTIMAALRKHGDVAMGNVIGSNMFNLLGIMGITSFFGPLDIPLGILHFDLWVMLGSALLIGPFVFFGLNISRFWGAVLTALYICYVFFLLA